jgi:hypothetical protein
MGQSASEKERRPNDQEDERASCVHSTSPACIAEQAHWIEPHQETDNGNSGVPDEFGGYVRKYECSPMVSTTFALPVYRFKSATNGYVSHSMENVVPGFIELSLDHEHRDDL